MLRPLLKYGIALVWLINGLACKVFNLVPRHQMIIESVLGVESGRFLSVLIGCLEILMACWVLSSYAVKLNTLMQIMIVLSTNLLEFYFVQDLLLWGKLNLPFACMFVLAVYYNGQLQKPKEIAKQ